MRAITSNAVANGLGQWENIFSNNNILGIETINGNYLSFHFQGYPASYAGLIGTVPTKWVPQNNLYVPLINSIFILIDTSGNIITYNASGGNFDLYGDCIVKLV